MYIGGKQTPPQPTHIPHRTMTNTELTLDQLQAVSGGWADTRVKKPSYNLREMQDNGELVNRKEMSFIPGDMYRWIPGDMY